jgi:hypothetical protein
MAFMSRSSKIWSPSATWSFFGLLILSFSYCIGVYVLPTLSHQDIENSYDAFSYAAGLSSDPIAAREFQPFLSAYPGGWNAALTPFFALTLHFLLLAPPVIAFKKLFNRPHLAALFAAFAIPESAMFLGSISKEGLGVVAVASAIAAQAMIIRGRGIEGLVMAIYAVGIAEFSRPLYGVPFGAALLIGFLPACKPVVRRRIYFCAALLFAFLIWALLSGPLAAPFNEKYAAAKVFLDWFEEEMQSDSMIKAAVRKFFTLAFSSDEPTLRLILLALVSAVGKAIVYILAIPLIAPANFTTMPAQTWALTWQVACSLSSLAMIGGLWRLRRIPLDVESKCRLVFGLMLLLVISLSTAIFHVRYRAPAVVVILAAVWMAHPFYRPHITLMNGAGFCAFTIAILTTL